jgi:hypothetical protein
MPKRLAAIAALFPGVLFVSAVATGRASSGVAGPDRRTYGGQDLTLVRIGAAEFTAFDSTQPFDNDPNGALTFRKFSGAGPLVAIGHVPSGALLDYFELDACDTNPNVDRGLAIDVSAILFDCDDFGVDCQELASAKSSDGSGGNTGCGFTIQTGIGHTVNNDRELVVEVATLSHDATNTFAGVYLGYRLQMSPAPGTATFADVPTSYLYFRAIEALAAAGITSGCGGGNFCPNQAVTRGEMAKFFAVALGLHWKD